MLKASNYKIGDPVYTWVDQKGKNVHIDSRLLRQWCLDNKPDIFLMPVEADIALSFVKHNVVDRKRVFELIKRYSNPDEEMEPIIFAKATPDLSCDAMLVDGHHRYFIVCAVGVTMIKCHMIEPSIWQQFQIDGFPDMTLEALKAAPTSPPGGRNY